MGIASETALHFISNVVEAPSKENIKENISECVKVPAVINLTCHSAALGCSQCGTGSIKLNGAD